MANDDLFCSGLNKMIAFRYPFVVLARRIPRSQLESVLEPDFARHSREGTIVEGDDLFGSTPQIVGSTTSTAGRPTLLIRPLYLKHAFNLSDEEVAARWSENVVWQYFSGLNYYTLKLPCDATQIRRFRTAIGEAPVEELHTLFYAAGYNLRWLLRAMIRLGQKAIFLRSFPLAMLAAISGNEDHRAVSITRRASRSKADRRILHCRLPRATCEDLRRTQHRPILNSAETDAFIATGKLTQRRANWLFHGPKSNRNAQSH